MGGDLGEGDNYSPKCQPRGLVESSKCVIPRPVHEGFFLMGSTKSHTPDLIDEEIVSGGSCSAVWIKPCCILRVLGIVFIVYKCIRLRVPLESFFPSWKKKNKIKMF
uniref:Uncharacterized protein n=1 Tax=Cacopsylla melanoneura TaxID=428564 RepID=A0A8D8Y567_9HEMI